MGDSPPVPARKPSQNDLYKQAGVAFGAALERLARAYKSIQISGATYFKKFTLPYGAVATRSMHDVLFGRGSTV